MSTLKIIEVQDGRLPQGMSGKDITGPIVLMYDGKLPRMYSEQQLADLGATVLSLKSGDRLPVIITQSSILESLQLGITEQRLEDAGIIIVADEVLAAGQALVEQDATARLAGASGGELAENLRRVEDQIAMYEARLEGLRQIRDGLARALAAQTE